MEGSRTQSVTATDIARGQIRVPRETKRFFPSERGKVRVNLLGHALECRWDPKSGPDRERSGVIGVPRRLLASLVTADEVLVVVPAGGDVLIERPSADMQPIRDRQPLRSANSRDIGERIDADFRPRLDYRRIRERAAAKYKPENVRLLLVAEAPPAAPDRYFYYPEVSAYDSLFRYVVRLVLGIEPDREGKPKQLKLLQSAGVFLIDLCPDPLSDRGDLKACVPSLVARATHLDADHIIVIKTRVYDEVAEPLREAGLPVVDARIAFPGSGQQRRFESEMRAALASISWSPDMSAQ